MSKWETVKIGTLCDAIFSGGTPKTAEPSYWDGDLLWLSSGETRNRHIFTTDRTITQEGVDNSSTRLALKGDIVMACAGQGNTRGQTSVVMRDMYINQSVIALRANPKKLHNLYLFHSLSSRYDELRAKSDASSTRGSITTDMLKKLPISIPADDPDLRIQTRIADILSAYDDAIENNNRRIDLLEKAAQELYKEWFVRFRFPGHESARFVNGLPEGWVVKRLGTVTNITSSKRIYLSDYVEEGIPFYRSKEVIQSANGEPLTEPLYISVEKYTELKDRFGAPQENDILITSVGTIGVSFLVDSRVFYFKDGNLTWLQSGKTPEIALYVFQWVNSDIGKSTLLSATIGTSQSALTIENLKKLKLIMPSKEVVSKYYKKAMALVKLKRLMQIQSQNLARQRDLLLPCLMSGKLEV